MLEQTHPDDEIGMPYDLLEADKSLLVNGLKAQPKLHICVSDSHETSEFVVYGGACKISEDPAHLDAFEGLRLLIMTDKVAVSVPHC